MAANYAEISRVGNFVAGFQQVLFVQILIHNHFFVEI